MKRFLESKPDFPKSGKTNYVHPSKVKDILQRPVYAGYVEAPEWGVKDTLATQIRDIDEQIEVLLDRVVDASSESLVRAYEAKIEKLEKHKLLLADQAAQAMPPKGRFDDFIEHTMTFLASPWNIYENGGIALRRTVLKLAFAEPLSYNRESGYRTAKTTFPFKVLAGISTQKCEMVGDPGIEPGVRLREGVTVPCHTLRPVAH